MTTATEVRDEIMQAFEAFKRHNDQQLEEIRKGGSASGETAVAVARANERIVDLQQTLDSINSYLEDQRSWNEGIESRLNRPRAGGGNYRRDFTDEQVESYAVFQSRAQGKDIDPANVDFAFVGAYRDAFWDRMRRGNRLSSESARILNEMAVVTSDAGGDWVDPDTSGRIVGFLRDTSPVRQFASVTTIDQGDALEGDYDVDQAGTGGWVNETATRAGDTTTPATWQYRIPLQEQYAEPRTTQRFLDMTRLRNAEDWLVRKVVDRFRRDENTAFVSGNGVHRPRGFTTYGAGTPATTSLAAYTVIQQVNSGAGAALTADGLINLVFSLKSGYREGAIFGGSRTTEAAVRLLKDTTNQYLWQPDFTERAQARLLGFPWVEMADLADIASNSLSVVFGNFAEGYQVVDSGGIRVLRDDLTTKGRVKFYTTKYVAGDVLNFEALKLQKTSA